MEKETIKEITKEQEEEIKKLIGELVEKIGIGAEVEMENVEQEDRTVLIFNLKTSESSFLIGQYGVNLQALQHIARLLVRKKINERANFILDVNFYRQEKNEAVAALAKNMAEEALTEKRAVVMRPMSPYERRLVHLELSKDDRIKTESIGEGEDRRVVIKPVELV
jgi:spoIIIJ-associated protein